MQTTIETGEIIERLRAIWARIIDPILLESYLVGITTRLTNIQSDTAGILVAVQAINANTAAIQVSLNNVIALVTAIEADTTTLVTNSNNIVTQLNTAISQLQALVVNTQDIENNILTLIAEVNDFKTSTLAKLNDLVKYEDASAVSGDGGVQILTVRQDTLATSTSNNGDYQPLKTDATGALYVTGLGGGGGGDATAANQTTQIAQARSKINRIKGAANFSQVITYVGATTDVNTVTYTGTTDLGAETIIMTLTYDGSNRITNVVYT